MLFFQGMNRNWQRKNSMIDPRCIVKRKSECIVPVRMLSYRYDKQNKQCNITAMPKRCTVCPMFFKVLDI